MQAEKVIFKQDLTEEIEQLRADLEYDFGREVFSNIYEAELDFDYNGFHYWIETSTDPRVVHLRELNTLLEECNEYSNTWKMIFRVDYSPENNLSNYVEVSFKDTTYQLIID